MIKLRWRMTSTDISNLISVSAVCFLLLTKNAPNCVSAVAFEVEKWRDTDNELVEQATKGPQVRQPTVLLLEEEFGWWVLQSAKECSLGDIGALLFGSDARRWNWRGWACIVGNRCCTSCLKVRWRLDCQAEVAQFGVAICIDQDVLWLQTKQEQQRNQLALPLFIH